jgi:hypothetical protein
MLVSEFLRNKEVRKRAEWKNRIFLGKLTEEQENRVKGK